MIYLAQTPAEEAGCLPTGEVCLCKMLLVRKNFIIFESLLFESAGEDRPAGAASAKPPRRLTCNCIFLFKIICVLHKIRYFCAVQRK